MGARLRFENETLAGGEPAGDLVIDGGGLQGSEVPAERAPTMIDEYPVLAVAALRLARRHQVQRAKICQRHHDARRRQHRHRKLAHREAARSHHHQFAVRRQALQGQQRAEEEGDGHDDQQQAG